MSPSCRNAEATAPQRGPLNSIGDCSSPDHYATGQVAADDIQAVVSYMNRQSFVEPNQTIVVGASSGGWASLALASRNPAEVRGVINFAAVAARILRVCEISFAARPS